jgi:Raf kinase inhibitor-like YbhB/YbcL family protein
MRLAGRRRAPLVSIALGALAALLVGCSAGGTSGGSVGGSAGDAAGGSAGDSATPHGAGSAATITVTSAAFDHGGSIPPQFTCDGDGISPPLQWSGVPAGTASIAVVVDDPDAPSGTFVHWVLAGLPGTDDTLVVDAAADPDAALRTVSARNSGGTPGWTPPCPPTATAGAHHYRFTVYALPGGAPFAAGAAADAAVRAITAAATGHGTLTGTYARHG